VIRREPVLVLAVGVLVLTVYAVVAKGGDKPARVVGHGQIRFNGLGPERWAQRARQATRALASARRQVSSLRLELRVQRRIVLRKPQVAEAINLACAVYGYCATLWRKARCETGGSFSPTSYNSSGASGLFQFLLSTWRSTPFAAFSVWSPYANALAAGWMHANGRGGEWVCQ